MLKDPHKPEIIRQGGSPLPSTDKFAPLLTGARPTVVPGSGQKLSLSSKHIENPAQIFSDAFEHSFGYAPTLAEIEVDGQKMWNLRVPGSFAASQLEEVGINGANLTPIVCEHWVVPRDALQKAFPALTVGDPDAVIPALQALHPDLAKANVSYEFWESSQAVVVSNMTPGKTRNDVLPPALAETTTLAPVDEAAKELSFLIPDTTFRTAAITLNSTHTHRDIPMQSLLQIAADKGQRQPGWER